MKNNRAALKTFLIPLFLVFLFSGCGSEKKTFQDFKIGLWSTAKGSLEELAIVRVLESFGIPYSLSYDFSSIRKKKAIIVAGELAETGLESKLLDQIYKYVEDGGSLFLSGAIARSLQELCGYSKLRPGKNRFFIQIKKPAQDSILRYVDEEEEFTWRLGNPDLFKETIWSFGGQLKRGRVLASFEDKSTAFSSVPYGQGRVYYLGVGLHNVLTLPQVGNDNEAQLQWVNHFEPTQSCSMLSWFPSTR